MKANKIRQQLMAWAGSEFEDADTIRIERGEANMWSVSVEWQDWGRAEIHSFCQESDGLRFLGVTEIEEA